MSGEAADGNGDRHRNDGRCSDDEPRCAPGAVVPVGRVCTVEDVAEAVLYLLSQRSSMVNAVDLNVDGAQSVAVAAAHSPQ